MLQSLFYLTIAVHVSGIIITHLQEHKTTVTTASGNCYTILLSVAIMEELELIMIMIPETCRAIVRENKLCDMCILLRLL
jgi:hypothetical protein